MCDEYGSTTTNIFLSGVVIVHQEEQMHHPPSPTSVLSTIGIQRIIFPFESSDLLSSDRRFVPLPTESNDSEVVVPLTSTMHRVGKQARGEQRGRNDLYWQVLVPAKVCRSAIFLGLCVGSSLQITAGATGTSYSAISYLCVALLPRSAAIMLRFQNQGSPAEHIRGRQDDVNRVY